VKKYEKGWLDSRDRDIDIYISKEKKKKKRKNRVLERKKIKKLMCLVREKGGSLNGCTEYRNKKRVEKEGI